MERLKDSERHESQRGYFAHALHSEMVDNPDIWFVTADLGWAMADKIMRDFPERAINVGAAETAALDISVGLALEGKVPFVYSITPFLLYRGFESIRNYIGNEQIPVKLIGGGRDKDYEHDGFSHWAQEDMAVLSALGQGWVANSHWPEDKSEVPNLIHKAVTNKLPTYINLRR